MLWDFFAPEQFNSLPPDIRVKVREALFARRELIDQFVQENPAQLTAEELAVVAGWKHALTGNFYVFRFLRQYTVFLSAQAPPKAYGVLALSCPLEELVGPDLPVPVGAVLLPIDGRIIYDGVLAKWRVSVGPNIRKSLNADYQRAKETIGIITALPEGSAPPAVTKKAPGKKPAASGGAADVKAVLADIVRLTDAFCQRI